VQALHQLLNRLQERNDKAFYLAALRVLVSLWFIKELAFRWPALELLYSNHSILQIPVSESLILFHIPAAAIRSWYLVIAVVCIVLLLLNLFGIGRNLTSMALFGAMTLLYHLNNRFSNSGDEMAMLLLFYLSFANTFSYFTLRKRTPLPEKQERLYNLLSNLASWSIILNLCLVYFLAGLFKTFDPYWQNGTALHYFLNDDRYSLFASGGRFVEAPVWLLYIINYGTLALELGFPVLVIFRKTRTLTLLLCFIMHLGIYSFLMVYAMSVTFILQYGMFYSNETMLALYQKISGRCRKLFRFAAVQPGSPGT